jgi:hypothetical protein
MVRRGGATCLGIFECAIYTLIKLTTELIINALPSEYGIELSAVNLNDGGLTPALSHIFFPITPKGIINATMSPTTMDSATLLSIRIGKEGVSVLGDRNTKTDASNPIKTDMISVIIMLISNSFFFIDPPNYSPKITLK